MRLIDADALIQDMIDKRIPFNADVNEAILSARTIGNYAEYVDRVWEIAHERGKEDALQWIPCIERLPEIGEHYVSEPCIVYCTNGAYGFAELEENLFGQVGWNCERDDEYHEPLGEVVAWMPLPQYEDTDND